MDARNTPVDRLVDQCARVVYGGGTVLFPTDTGYALGCDPMRASAVERIAVLADGGDAGLLTLFVASPAEFLEYARGNAHAPLAAKRLLPGPVVLLVARPGFLSEELTGGRPELPIRVPDEPVATAILDRVGPLIAAHIRPERAVEADLRIENGPPRYEREASVVDLTQQPARLLRDGAVAYDRLAAALGSVARQIVKVRSQS